LVRHGLIIKRVAVVPVVVVLIHREFGLGEQVLQDKASMAEVVLQIARAAILRAAEAAQVAQVEMPPGLNQELVELVELQLSSILLDLLPV
jgi:hypothetical protein